MLIDVMLGLWNDGFRKQIIINNHGHLWMLESAIQQFQKRYQLPGIFRVIDWHRAVREFFRTKDKGGKWDTNFVHADESETSLGLLLHPEMVDMDYAVDTEGKGYLPDGHFDKSVDPFSRPSRWSEGEGHFAIEIRATPEGVVGKATHGDAEKAKRPLAAILSYLTLLNDQILEAFPQAQCRRWKRSPCAPKKRWSRICASRERGLEAGLSTAEDRSTVGNGKMKLSVVLSTHAAAFQAVAFKGDFEANVAKIASWGYDGVELAVRDPKLVNAGQLERVVADNGLVVPAIGTGQAWGEEGLSFTSNDPDGSSCRHRADHRATSRWPNT